ncbi:chromosome segregation protein SMC [Pollutimonas harenae]|uniref:Chromosome partition protein Smc n=1 Tax=Pollutimonas harenae TaxID=657015 RepID=A0A853GZG2_9BURK|nr:chromosome segregation protein SMC [Pollutimonas harenae]NYT85492.1 chromosome segregation protein SMC [Pollutimonas harenae]TEA70581.1 chromosome segregation protein SMC [Pollutimonas harenae]
MRLTQIKLAGFKSFVEPTVIPTPSQLVGVVGPNGCGKSNIIDAVRWVLGESKASELRGESMQDVIFNGSGQRKPAARASVELVFDNSEGRATGQWSTYSEIAVRRVLTRDGTSSYLINNQQVRRRDIHDIFLGTGLGARGYAIIGQGMINRLIEARPEELRVFLEEAAGVSRYKERRRETENRLGDTRENLIRVEDILRELGSQLEKLEIQAEVASQYRALQEDGEQKQHALWLLKEDKAREDQKSKFLAIEQAQTELEAATASLRAGEAELESRRQAHYAAGDAVHAAQGLLFEAGAQVSRLEAEIRHVVDARNRVQSRRGQLQQQMQEWADQQTHCTEQIAQSEADQEIAAARTEELRAQADEAQGLLPDIENKVRAAALSRDEMRGVLAKVEQELALVAQSQRDSDRQLQVLEQRQERLNQELRGLNAPDPASVERLAGDSAAIEEQLEEAQAQLLEQEDRLPGLDEQRRQAQAHAQEESQAVSRLDARLGALSKLQDDVQKQGALEPWLAHHELNSLGRLWQKLHIESGWETALESVLRERMAGLELRQLEHARAFAGDAPPARLAFYQLPAPAPAPAVPQGMQPLAELLRISDPDLRSLLNDWLAQVYVCADVEKALALRADLPAGGLYVVQEGHLIDRHSIRFYAADSEQEGLLARQQEIENLQRDLKARQLIADEAVGAVARAENAWQQVASSLVPARQRVAELTRRLHDVQLEYSKLKQQAEQSDERAGRIHEDLAEIKLHTEELMATKEEAEARFEALDIQLGEHQMRFSDAEISGEGLQEQAEQARQRLRDLERSVHESEYAERALQTRLADLKRNLQLAGDQAQRAQDELEGLQGELFELDASASQAGLQDALALRAEREEALNLTRIELDNLAATLRTADEERVSMERSLEPRRARIMELQLQEQAARLAIEQFAEQLDGHQVDRDQLRQFLAEQSEEWRRANWLQSEVQRISRTIEGLGSVNLAALDELNTARERKGFLDSQHQDLTLAIETLEDAIRKIDRETRALLQDTFDTVNGHFGDLFPRLFGGGEARLTIIGDEILDAGVQVMAQPPGKRNSTIHLLSGGEKALTATALVFALFKLNPAPFCLLDEVDAPLDDANTERYANLVGSMSEQTQFLFISHNKIAMQMAKQLVGVTMQEQGVSRIVAVDIDSALQLAEA